MRIEAADGTVGWGEAASAPTMTGDTQGGLVAAVRHLTPLLVGQNGWTRPQLIARLHAALMGNTGAHSAIEMALLDLAGRAVRRAAGRTHRRRGARLRCPHVAARQFDRREGCCRGAGQDGRGLPLLQAQGGTKPLEHDIAATHAVREALGRAVPLCADANCGFAPEAAQRYVEATREAGLLFLEQPLGVYRSRRLGALARLHPCRSAPTKASIPWPTSRRMRVRRARPSLKLIKLGGFGAAIEAAALCERLGLEINVAAKIAEFEHRHGRGRASGLRPAVDGLGRQPHAFLSGRRHRQEPLPLRDGLVSPPSGPGLGVDVDEAAVARLRVT